MSGQRFDELRSTALSHRREGRFAVNLKNRRTIFWARVAAAIVTVSSLYLFAPWEAGVYFLKPLPSTLQEEVNAAADQHVAGIVVYVQKGSDPGQAFAAGWHDRTEQIPAFPAALFKIASIAKLYDAAAMAQLAANGVLALDDSLAFHMPELKGRIEYADRITLRMMVQHRSGIPNFTDQPEFDWSQPDPDVLAMALDKPALFEPDTGWSYSNTNYLLLQQVMTRALGHDYTDFIRARMLMPLGLRDTFFSAHEEGVQSRLMSGYFVGHASDLKSLDQGYVASAADVGRFLRALNDGSVFTGDARAIYASLYEFGHDGWVLGYLSKAWYHADIDTVVVQFINTNGDDTVLLSDIVYDRLVELLRRQAHQPGDRS